MEITIKDTDLITHGTNTVLTAVGCIMIATAHYRPEQLSVKTPVGATVLGTLMIIAAFTFALVLGDTE